MSVSLRPINNDDKKIMVKNARDARINRSPMTSLNNVMGEPNTVVSASIFCNTMHNVKNSDDKVFEDKYTRVGYIELTKPVLNPFLAGRKAPVWTRVLNMSEREVSRIIDGRLIYDVNNDELVEINSVSGKIYNPEEYVFGAELLVKLLHEVDIDESIRAALYKEYIKPLLSKSEKDEVAEGLLNFGEFIELNNDEVAAALQGELGDNIGWVYGNYAIDLSNSGFGVRQFQEYGGMSRREKLLYDLDNFINDKSIESMTQFPVLDTLCTIKRDGLQTLESQILHYIFVLPYGYRPTIDKRVDSLTAQYNKLVYDNEELQNVLDRQNQSVGNVIGKYTSLVQHLRNIFVGDDAVKARDHLNKDYKSLSDMLTGKTGLIRDRMQGARMDYSGRAVITSDPTMPIDMVGIPIKMLMKVMEPSVIKELRSYDPNGNGKSQFTWKNLSTFSQTATKEKDGITYEEFVRQYFENGGRYDRYGLIGRNPTLFYLGMQGFRIKPIEGDAIALSPLVVMPFNADHDGDQMHFEAFITKRGYHELKNNLYFKNNMRYPKNGEITVVTRHEIIYGLWICKQKGMLANGTHYSQEQVQAMCSDIKGLTGYYGSVFEAVCLQRLNVYDVVSTQKGDRPAGIVALEYAVFGGSDTRGYDFASPDFKVKAKLLTKIASEQGGTNKDTFLSAINRMVRLGFAVAKVWPPNISVIVGKEITDTIQNMIKDFNEDILSREEYVNLGIETEEEFSAYFSSKWKVLEHDVTEFLTNNLDPENGYLSMWKSGAKGDENNLRQIFGLKGRVQKNDISTFNSIVAGSYSGQLTGLEHLITAYGSRQGIADKVLATAEPGYMSRRLEHASTILCITSEDCGTDEGLEFTLKDVVPFIDVSQVSKYGVYPESYRDSAIDAREKEVFWNRPETLAQYDAAKSYLAEILIGHYVFEPDGNEVYIDGENAANYIIDECWKNRTDGVVKMRSPIYCKNPCCQKCYGRDVAAGTDKPAIGRPIGFIAAQAIGEPGTQMTMKNFQKGGVVTEANLTSSFELIDDYLELHDLSKKRRNKRGIISYDRLSPETGFVKEQYLGNGGKRVIVTRTQNEEDRNNLIPGTTKIIVQEDTVLKSYVTRGESFQKIQGDLNMREVLRYRGYDKAVVYLTMKLFDIFKTQNVDFRHFETIVASMTVMQLCADAPTRHAGLNYGRGSTFRVGSVLTLPEIYYGVDYAIGTKTLVGLKALPKYRSDFFESLIMEAMDSYVPRAIIMNPNDSMSNPITRAMFGMHIGIGTDMEDRNKDAG